MYKKYSGMEMILYPSWGQICNRIQHLAVITLVGGMSEKFSGGGFVWAQIFENS